jgi:DNA (cytosine-5)-methyltransferase 1
LAKNKPSLTIPAQPAQNTGPFHWSNRQLSTAEMLRLQSFPSATFIAGSRADRQCQIGNAVPPLLAEAIGRAIIASLNGEEIPESCCKLTIPREKTLPRPARARSLNKLYLHMVGQHEDHPGTGLGPAAR